MGQRDNRLDTIKGLLIILVVLGHLIGHNNIDVINERLSIFIYTFHMPLFIIVSGYVSRIKNDRIVFRTDILRLAIPLCIFQTISAFLLYIEEGKIEISMILVPYWTLWYLLSLIFWRLILESTPKKLLNNPFLYLLIAISISILCGIIIPHGRILSIQRTFNFFPFFLLGYYIKQGVIIARPWNKSISACLICIYVILIGIGFYPEKSDILLRGADSYSLFDTLAKTYLLICSFLISFSVFIIMIENKCLSLIGKESLFYYLYHGVIIKFVLQPLSSFFGLPQTFPFVILYSAAIITFIFCLSKIRLFKWITNPTINYRSFNHIEKSKGIL